MNSIVFWRKRPAAGFETVASCVLVVAKGVSACGSSEGKSCCKQKKRGVYLTRHSPEGASSTEGANKQGSRVTRRKTVDEKKSSRRELYAREVYRACDRSSAHLGRLKLERHAHSELRARHHSLLSPLRRVKALRRSGRERKGGGCFAGWSRLENPSC